jgi:hypothetical protein
MADYYTHFSELLPHLSPQEEGWLRQQLEQVRVIDSPESAEDQVPQHLAER